MLGRTAMLALLLTAGLAGCIGEDGSAGEGTSAEDPTAEELGVDEAGTLDDQDTADLAYTEVPVSWDGSVGTMAFGCAVVTCAGTGVPMGWDVTESLATEPTPVSATFTLTWEDPTGLQELAIGYSDSGCDDSGGCDIDDYTVGTSGVTLALDNLSIDEGDVFEVYVWHPYRAVALVGLQAGPQTSFHVDGTVVVQVPV